MFGFTNIHDFSIKTLLSLLLILYVCCELGIIYSVLFFSPYLLECDNNILYNIILCNLSFINLGIFCC